MKKIVLLSALALVSLSILPSASNADLPNQFAEMRACQKAGEASMKPFAFFDAVRARNDLNKDSKEHCFEWTLVRNRVIQIEEQHIDAFVKALVDAENANLNSAQIFRVITGR